MSQISPQVAGYRDQAQKRSVLSGSIPDTLIPISALVACVIVAILVQLHAGVALRGVYADGAFFATQILADYGVVIMQPARAMSEMIYEWPVVLVMRCGVHTAHGVALIFSVVTNVLPGLIILLCFAIIPSGRRCLFIFPAFVYFAGIIRTLFSYRER